MELKNVLQILKTTTEFNLAKANIGGQKMSSLLAFFI